MEPNDAAVAEDERTAEQAVEDVIDALEDANLATEAEAEAPQPDDAPAAEVTQAGLAETPEAPAHREALYGRVWGLLPEVLPELAIDALSSERYNVSHEAARRMRASVQTIQPNAEQGTVAVIALRGVITPRGSFLARLFGYSAGLEAFRDEFREAVNDESVKAIIIDVDSPGGTIDLVSETAAEVYAARGKKPIVAISNTMCASAAYWIACQADEIVCSPSGQVGSIGVFTVHEDVSAAAARMGIKITIVSAGKYKTEGNSYEPLSKQAQQALQSKADDLYAMFTSDIARARGVPVQAVQAGFGEGRCVLSAQALALKMVDRIETFEQTAARLGATLSDDEESEGSDDPCEDDETAPGEDDSPESPEAVGGSAAAADYLSGEGVTPSWQIIRGRESAATYLPDAGPKRPSWQL